MNQMASLERYYRRIEREGGDYHCRVIMEINRVQPLIISIMRAQAEYLKRDEMDEIVKLGCAIWDTFSERPAVRSKQITFDQYTACFKIHMFKRETLSVVHEPTGYLKRARTADMLFPAILQHFSTNPVLRQMDTYNQGFQIAVLKSLTECLDKL